MNVIQEIKRINKRELELGLVNTPASWHTKYQNAAWVYIGNVPHELTEGDVICVFSQWGEVDDIHLVRDSDTGKSKGFCFLKYYDSRSCILAVDNFCGITVLGRSIRVDHVEQYRLPKHLQDKEEKGGGEGEDDDQEKVPSSKSNNIDPGHAYQGQDLANAYTIHQGQDLFQPVSSTKPVDEEDEQYPYLYPTLPEEETAEPPKKKKKSKDKKRKEEKRKEKKRKKEKRSKKSEKTRQESDSNSSS
jgi:RNA-binding motif X-linked protein 2